MQRASLWTHVKDRFENAQWKQSLQAYILWFNQDSQYWNMGVLLVLRLIISLFPRVAQNFCPSFAWWAFAFQVNIAFCLDLSRWERQACKESSSPHPPTPGQTMIVPCVAKALISSQRWPPPRLVISRRSSQGFGGSSANPNYRVYVKNITPSQPRRLSIPIPPPMFGADLRTNYNCPPCAPLCPPCTTAPRVAKSLLLRLLNRCYSLQGTGVAHC